MITLITGTPGAGKTLYAITKLLRDLVGSVVKGTDDAGNPTETKRVIYTNINGLLLDHEKIDGSNTGGLANWHEWAKPGSVICFDEVQREWPPRPNGSKVPDFISALETHRHMGVDFIILTQNPMLLDQNVRALVGRHVHIRRMGGVGVAVAYEWDHCSRQLLFSKSLKKAPFKYDKSVFKLYKSAELHTKPKTSVPTLVWVVLAAVLAMAYFVPAAIDRVAAKGDKSKEQQAAQAVQHPQGTVQKSSVPPGGYDASAFVPVVSNVPGSAPAYDALRIVTAIPRVIGGFCRGQGDDCTCFTQQATVAFKGLACREWIKEPPFDPYRVAQVGGTAEPAPASAGVPTPSLPFVSGN